jgi:tripartite-type tricarboxylate transporter receptor subunit TctC
MLIRRPLLIAALCAATCAAPVVSSAQDAYPAGPVRMIITFAAGGGVDIPGRALARALEETLGKPVVVDNRAGAGGTVGAVAAARAKPDGYTIVLGTVAQIIGKQLQPSVAFDPLTDFVPISLAYKTQGMLTVSSRSAVKTPLELVDWAKAKPGAVNYYSGGVGTGAHLLGATFSEKRGLKAVHIPVRTVGDMMPQLGDDVPHFAFWVTPSVMPMVKAGQLRPLAVSSRNRLAIFPEVPTLFELFKDEDFVQESWAGIWVPAGTPPAVVNRLFEATTRAVQSPAFKAAMEQHGQTPVASASVDEFTEYLRTESRKWAKLVALAQLKAN